MIAWIRRLRNQRRCLHHWHVHGLIDWYCCWCDRWTDGYPNDRTLACKEPS